MPQLFIALDTPDPAAAAALAGSVAPYCDGLKVGLEYFTANGPEGLKPLHRFQKPLFLDLKLHDIPNTVMGAVASAAGLGVSWLTVHTSGGRAMLEAAKEAAGSGPLQILGVTVLTSLDEADLHSLGVQDTPANQVLRLAALAEQTGLDGIVCAAMDLPQLAPRFGYHLVTPGIRPAGAGRGDQKRTLTPLEAVAAGATHLVVGRPVTAAADPAAAAAALYAELNREPGHAD